MTKCNKPAYGLLYDIPISENTSGGHFYCWDHFIKRQKEIDCNDNGLPTGNEICEKKLTIIEILKRISRK